MNIIWYLFVCGSFLGGGYALSKREENKRLRTQLRKVQQQPEPIRQFIDMAA